jgi:hypothetical protein
MTCLDAALEYIKRGFRVFPVHGILSGKCTCQTWRDQQAREKNEPTSPCPTPGKHPRFANWQGEATIDPEKIRKWFTGKLRGSNVGIATGATSGIFVLDVDLKSGGEESLASLIDKHGRLPNTLQAVTGSGGHHYYFTHPGVTVKNGVAIRPGIDIRGDGGLVVAAPSMHMSGRQYDWDGMDSFDASIMPAPDWLFSLMTEQRRAEPAKVTPISNVVPDGQRNDTLFRLACSLRGKGLGRAAILAALKEENRERCSPPLNDQELQTITASASKYEQGGVYSDEVYGDEVSVKIPIDEVSIADLNRSALFSGRLRFESVWRRGANTFARIHNGREQREIRWGCDAELLSFSKSQSVLMGAGVLIPSPRKGDIRPKWESAVRLILLLADTDRVDTGDAIVLETEERLVRTFTSAGKPVATEERQMATFMAALANYRRNPAALDAAPPCVFVAEGQAWVHVPTWRAWMSTPQGYNRLYMVRELHDGLAAVGFTSAANVVRRADGSRYQLDLWCGDIPDCLVDNEAAD